MHFVSTTKNKADCMSKVLKAWLRHHKIAAALLIEESVEDEIWAAHLFHHLDVDRTLYLAK